MTWIIEIMSNVKGHKNKPSIFKSKKATRQPSNLCPPPIETLAMVIDISNSLQCNNDLQSQSHFFFWRTVYFEFYSNNMEGNVLEKKKFSCITLDFAKMDRTYFFFFYFPFQIPFTTPDAKCLHSLFCDIHRVSILSTPLVRERKLNVMRKGS